MDAVIATRPLPRPRAGAPPARACRTISWTLGLLLLVVAPPASAQPPDAAAQEMATERRVALVIGNSAYPSSPLRNPVNDARAIGGALRSLGFEVLERTNAGEKDMKRAIEEFGDRLRAGGVGLFFFAGHGLQVGGRNFLVPTDAQVRTERDVDIEAIDVARVLARMEDARNRLNIVILDACRDNPLGRSFRNASRGLASIDAPSGTLLAYATSPGKVARDGEGQNGVYTGELLKAMREPGLRIEDVFKRVRRAVQGQTGGEQVPWESSSLVGDFVFAVPARQAAAAPPAGAPGLDVREEMRREVGVLAITAPIAGVDVWIGDRKVGTTRAGVALVVSNVPAGAHRLTAKKAGHKDWDREVRVAANQRAQVVVDIEPLRALPGLRGDDGAEMVLVPAGELSMGSLPAEVEAQRQACQKDRNPEGPCKEHYERELPQHRVVLDAFHIDRYEVTNELFERFVSATGHRTTAEREGKGTVYQRKDGKWQYVAVEAADWRRPTGPGSTSVANHPVVQVSWHDADAYCRWAGKRLPTEAEWEKAARGSDGRRYPWGDEWDASKANGRMSAIRTRPVGSYPAGVSPYDVHDMAGNVSEWVADWFDAKTYERPAERNPSGPPTGQRKIVRGGSWKDTERALRAASRWMTLPPALREASIGFRCARGGP